MKITRRQFLKSAAIAGVGLGMPLKFGVRSAYPFAQSPTNIRKFVTTLPGLGPGGANNIGQYIPLATKVTQTLAGQSTDVYNLGVKKFGEKMHPDHKKATHFYGYYDLATGDQKYLAGVIVAKRGTPVLLNVTNQMDPHHILPIDPPSWRDLLRSEAPILTWGSCLSTASLLICTAVSPPGSAMVRPSSGLPPVG
jgi:hypothetical protein